MKVHEIQHGVTTTIGLRSKIEGTFGTNITKRAEATLQFNEITDDALLTIGEVLRPVKGQTSRDEAEITRLRSRSLPTLCWVAATSPQSGPTEMLTIQVHEFPALYELPDTVDIGVDENIVEDIRRREGKTLGISQVVSWLTEKLILEPSQQGSKARVFISGSPNPQAQQQNAFRIVGHGIAIDVVHDSGDQLRITRVVGSRRSDRIDQPNRVFIVRGNIQFCDITVAGKFRRIARTMLDEMVANAGSYFKLWQDYNRLEREIIEKKARSFGWLRYNARPRPLPDGKWRVYVEERKELESAFVRIREAEDVVLELADAPPPELLDQDTSDANSPKSRIAFLGKCISTNLRDGSMDLQALSDRDEYNPPESGVIFMSFSGDRKRLERREDALRSIMSAECKMPQLGLLIEGKSVPERRGKKEKPLSQAVRDSFVYEPTARQIEALRISLNTPDIALIQGPPGTGKTMVIAALESRLAEIADKGLAGQTLLTSYQHDAVENAASKTIVFGLPAVKIGRRLGNYGDSDDFERWRRERVDALRADVAQIPARPVTEALRRAQIVSAAYVASPGGLADAIQALKTIREEGGSFLPPEIRDEMLSHQHRLQKAFIDRDSYTSDELDFTMKALRGLRVDKISFCDDGPRSAYMVLKRADQLGKLEADERGLLDRASQWNPADGPPPFLDALAGLKGILIDRLNSTRRTVGQTELNSEVQHLLGEAVHALRECARRSQFGKESVLAEHLHDLENDVSSVREMVKEYTAVLAATCQQAVSHHMSDAKGVQRNSITEADSSDLTFENVIVDEAARSNPLDLMIPISRAERRIILVGDHRQLPHILEPDIEAQLDKSALVETQEALRKSLFWRLFTDMREREKKDGIKRTVTLDVQYRMHPVLGDFVSDTFYKPYGEAFSSGRPASDFSHNLEGYGRAVAAWVSIPLSKGREQGRQSKRRQAEAQWIAAEVKRLMVLRPDLSFGIISFYSAQVDEIMKVMEPWGLTELRDDGSYAISPGWRETSDSRGRLVERLRVGTVDAFQGKEFDVVILSMTRSNDLPAKTEGELRRKYGHLMLENRLCVAMSRQKRILIVAGDDGMLAEPGVVNAIPGLIEFYKLTGGVHGLRIPS